MSTFKADCQTPWNIPTTYLRTFCPKNIAEMLSIFNRAGDNDYVVVDYYHQKFILGASSVSTLTGHSREVIQKEGWNYYQRILKKEELDWLTQINAEIQRFLMKYPESQRKNLEFFYNLTAETVDYKKLILHHKLVPYRFCKNGNLWLGLCFIKASTAVQSAEKAFVFDRQTGEKYHFIKGKFRLSKQKNLTREELRILELIAQDISSEQICDMLGITPNILKRKKRNIYTVLNVRTSAGAVYKVQKMGMI